MIDMDHLKRFNDTWGHASGDLALKAVAGAIRDVTPSRGIACRYGGEEFLIAVTDIDDEQLIVLSQNILDGIRTQAPLSDQPEVHLTASLGTAMLNDGETIDGLLQRADAACCAAKNRGRNRIEAAGHD